MTVAIDIFRVLSSTAALVMALSPIPTIFGIYRKRSTGFMPMAPLVAMFTNSHMWMMYGYLKTNYYPIFATYALSEVLCVGYIAVYYAFTTDRPYAHRLFLVFGAACVLATTYAFLGGYGATSQSRNHVANIVGYLGIAAALVLYISPFEKIRQVLRHRSAVFIPVFLTVAGITNNAMWIVYATLTRNWLIMVPNVAFLCSGLAQAALYVAFHPSSHPLPPQEVTPAKSDFAELSSPVDSHLC